jgi:hypothetical protein
LQQLPKNIIIIINGIERDQRYVEAVGLARSTRKVGIKKPVDAISGTGAGLLGGRLTLRRKTEAYQ